MRPSTHLNLVSREVNPPREERAPRRETPAAPKPSGRRKVHFHPIKRSLSAAEGAGLESTEQTINLMLTHAGCLPPYSLPLPPPSLSLLVDQPEKLKQTNRLNLSEGSGQNVTAFTHLFCVTLCE